MASPTGSGCGRRGRASACFDLGAGADRSRDERRVADEVALPKPARLGAEAMHPLDAVAAHPLGRLGLVAGDEVERGTDGDERGFELVPVVVDEVVLLRRAEADPHDVGAARLHALDELLRLVVGQRTERRRLDADDLDAGCELAQAFGHTLDHLRRAAVEVVAQAGGDAGSSGLDEDVAAARAVLRVDGEAEATGEPRQGHAVGEVEVTAVDDCGVVLVLRRQRERVRVAEVDGATTDLGAAGDELGDRVGEVHRFDVHVARPVRAQGQAPSRTEAAFTWDSTQG